MSIGSPRSTCGAAANLTRPRRGQIASVRRRAAKRSRRQNLSAFRKCADCAKPHVDRAHGTQHGGLDIKRQKPPPRSRHMRTAHKEPGPVSVVGSSAPRPSSASRSSGTRTPTRSSPAPGWSTPTRPPRSRPAGRAGTSRRSRRCATPGASTCPGRSPTPASSPTRTSAWRT